MDDTEVHVDIGKGETNETAIAVLKARVAMLTRVMVTKQEFEPVKMISYGFATIVISSVLIAVLSYVLRKM